MSRFELIGDEYLHAAPEYREVEDIELRLTGEFISQAIGLSSNKKRQAATQPSKITKTESRTRQERQISGSICEQTVLNLEKPLKTHFKNGPSYP